MNQIVRNAVAGVMATVLMSVPIAVAHRLHLFTTPPPEEVSDQVAKSTPLLPDSTSFAFPVMWPISHLTYGAACGVVYGKVAPMLPRSVYGSGLLFGGAVWAVSYAGYLPALDLYPTPAEDRSSRVVTMILAHAVYGVTVAALIRRPSVMPS